MGEAVKGTVEMNANRIVICKPHGPQMLCEAVVEAAIRLSCVQHAAQRTGEDVHKVLGLAVKVRQHSE